MIHDLHSPLTDMELKILLKICLMIPKEAFRSRKSNKDGKHNDKRNKRTIRKIMIYKTLHRKLKMEQHEPH
jgi:hypothetical protein